jgi:hypothetical protein
MPAPAVGLTTMAFLVIAGPTSSVLAFREEIDWYPI